MHSLDPTTYPMADSWVKAVKNKADITPGKLAERATELMKRRKPGHTLMFVVDEVGQFVARDVQKMLDLQAIVQSLGVKGRGKHWVVVTSQEKLGELVSGLDDKKIELARLMDRFPLQVHLEPSDISEVTSRRVLSKNAAAQAALGKLFDEHRGRLTEHTRLTADIKLPELTRESFIDLYPLLPYQIDLIIQVVSGLRTQGGASKHVGGANRTIIKLAQQLLINPAVNLADAPARRPRAARPGLRPRRGEHRLRGAREDRGHREGAEPPARAAGREGDLPAPVREERPPHAPRTSRPPCTRASAADSQLASVKEALRELEAAHKVRHGDDGYRIPTPAEDDWERLRNGISPKPGDSHRLYSEVLSSFWQPQPSHTLFDTKTFKAGLAIHGREVVERRHDVPGPPRRRRQGASRRSRPSCARAASRSGSTSSGPSRSTTRSTARPSSCSARRRCSPARSARRRARTRPRSSPRSAFASAGTATSFAACSARRASRAASTSAATTAAPATAPSTSARPPPRSSARCCPRSSTASRRPPRRRPT